MRVAALREIKPISEPRNRVVLIRPDHFGDLLMLIPALDWIRDRNSDLELILMTGPWNEAVARHLHAVDQVVTYPFPGFTRGLGSTSKLAPYRAVSDAAKIVRDLQPRSAILLRDDHWWGAWMTREAGVPLRFGYVSAQTRPFLTHPIDVSHAHYVEQNLELIERSLAVLGFPIDLPRNPRIDLPLRWPVDQTAEAEANARIAGSIPAGRFLVIHPGTGAAVKRWPEKRWAEVADTLCAQTGLKVVLTGSPDERDLCASIECRASSVVTSLAGETSLFVLAEILRRAEIVLGVDSGPLHLASAVGTSSVSLFGPSDSRRYGPWGDPARHLKVHVDMNCPRCGDLSENRPEGCGCMIAITPDQVVDAALKVLGDAK